MEFYKLIKRMMDFLFALFLLILLSPLIILLALSMLVTSGKPVMYLSERVGKDKKMFKALKFRTLVNNAKELQKQKGYRTNPPDERLITPVGRILRATHLDELPQLFNILKGDLSFIGPRPLDVDFYKRYIQINLDWQKILRVTPGLSCINQIARYSDSGMKKVRNLKSLTDIKKRNRLFLDIYYVNNESFILDMKITLWTIEYIVIGFFKKLFKKEESSLP